MNLVFYHTNYNWLNLLTIKSFSFIIFKIDVWLPLDSNLSYSWCHQILIYILISFLRSECSEVETWYSWNLIWRRGLCVGCSKCRTFWQLITRHALFQDTFSNVPEIVKFTMIKSRSLKSHDKLTLLNFWYFLIIFYSPWELFHQALC